MGTNRKPVLGKRKTGKFKKQPFQLEDIGFLGDLDSSANWSEMGAMKTTTAEWLWQQKLSHIPNPRVLVITTKAGKGTYFESLGEVLPDWDVFTVSTRGAKLVLGARPVPFWVELPNPLHFRPVVVVAHYHCFTNRSCHPKELEQIVTLEDGSEQRVPILNENGTFEMVIPFCNTLLRREWDFVILDEAHKIKNSDAQWTRNIKKLTTKYKHIMTGTGFVNNPAEIWSLLNFLYPKTYTSFDKFYDRYCDWEDYSGYKKVTGIKKENEQEFKELVRRIGVRRTMLECFPDIPEPIETVVPVSLNPTQKKMYDQIQMDLWTLDQKGEPLHSPNVLSLLNRLRQISVATPDVKSDEWSDKYERRIIEVELIEPSSKLDAAMDIIEGLEWDSWRKDQIVVFSYFRDPIALLKKRLDKAKITYLHLHSGLSEKDMYEMWHETWPQGNHQVFLSTLGKGSESINLTAAHRCIFLDQSWSPVQNNQAIGRVYRPGQKHPAQLIYIRAENTVDYKILDANVEKSGWFNQIFGNRQIEDADDKVEVID
jgi:hypothetical protein